MDTSPVATQSSPPSGRQGPSRASLSEIERRLLNDFQRALPLCPEPFSIIGEALGCSQEEVIETLERLQASGHVSRVGPVFQPRRIGASTLAAIAVPPTCLDEVAAIVSSYPEVNHNYEREHEINLWFVVTAPGRARLDAVLDEIRERTGLEVLDLPLERAFHLDLGFRLW